MADYYQLLGVTPQASAGEIRHAYAQLAREKHPDRFPDPAAKQQTQRAFQDITTAFNTLANPKSRQEYDATRDKPVPRTPEEIATDAYERSQAALEAGDLDEAVMLLRTAVHHAPTQVAYQLALGRALGRAEGPAAHQAIREAVTVLEKVTQLAPNNATAFVETRDGAGAPGPETARAEGKEVGLGAMTLGARWICDPLWTSYQYRGVYRPLGPPPVVAASPLV